jgi:subtilisin family serine protease
LTTTLLDDSEGSPDLWNHQAIGLDYMHSQGIDGSGIRIGLLDTGLDADHPEIMHRLVGWAEFDNVGNPVPSQPHETHHMAHGTHVASVLVGQSAGVAPGAELLSALVLPDGYGTVEQVLAGMQWIIDPDGDPATDDGAQIVNMSWGLPETLGVLKDAVESMRAAGILPVAAIGNNGRNTSFAPGNVPGAVGVGAVNEYDNIAVFSGGGEVCWDKLCLIKPDLSAPGTNIYGAGLADAYQLMSGTSAAAPHVAGAAALLWHYEASLSLPLLQRYLMHAARDLGSWGMDSRFGWGSVDLQSAVEFIDLYANRTGAADLVIEKTKTLNNKTVYRYYTFFSDGETGFLPHESDFLTLASSSPSSSIVPAGLGDVDGDGFDDLIIRNTIPLENEVYAINWKVYTSMGAHGFAANGTIWHTIETADPEAYRLIGIVDVDGDHRTDLVLSRVEDRNQRQDHHIFALLSTGSGFALSPAGDWAQITTMPYYRYHFGAGDVDGDGRADMIMTKTFDDPYYSQPTFGYIGLSQGDEFGPLTYWLNFSPVYPYRQIERFFFGDVNGDRSDDLIFYQKGDHWSGLPVNVYVCLSYGGNQFLQPRRWAEIDPADFSTIDTLADVNGDGAHDLVVRFHNQEMDTNTIHVWLADGQNEAFISTEQPWFEDSYGVLTGEFNVVGAANVGLGTW